MRRINWNEVRWNIIIGCCGVVVVCKLVVLVMVICGVK